MLPRFPPPNISSSAINISYSWLSLHAELLTKEQHRGCHQDYRSKSFPREAALYKTVLWEATVKAITGSAPGVRGTVDTLGKAKWNRRRLGAAGYPHFQVTP